MDISLSQPISYWDGLVLMCLLLLSRFGYQLKTYGDVVTRQWVCSILGFILASLILDDDVGYFVLAVFIAILSIFIVGPRYCHIAAFITMFGYLSWYRINQGLNVDLFANYLITSTTLNLTGIAFEIHQAYEMTRKGIRPPILRPKVKKILDEDVLKLGIIDVVHYTYSYTTIVTGPYVRYQVYIDFIQIPYAIVHKRPTVSQDIYLKIIIFLVPLFVGLQSLWPTSYIFSMDFTLRSPLYKILFAGIVLLKYRLLSYIHYYVMMEINTHAGMGVYGKSCKTVCVYGPTAYDDKLQDLMTRRFFDVPTDLQVDVESITVTNPFECETSRSVSESINHWNKGLLYWLDEYIFRLTLEGVECYNLRLILTVFVCILWHGFHPGLLVLGVLVLYYLYIESVFLKFRNEVENTKIQSVNGVREPYVIRTSTQAQYVKNETGGVIDVGLCLSKHIIFAWCLMPYFLPNLAQIWTYYAGTYFAPLIFLIIMHFVGIQLNIASGNLKNSVDDKLDDNESYVTFKM